MAIVMKGREGFVDGVQASTMCSCWSLTIPGRLVALLYVEHGGWRGHRLVRAASMGHGTRPTNDTEPANDPRLAYCSWRRSVKAPRQIRVGSPTSDAKRCARRLAGGAMPPPGPG